MKTNKKQKTTRPPTRKERVRATMDAYEPSIVLLCKLGSMIVHADEAFSPDGRRLDQNEFYNLHRQPDVQAWLKAMAPMLPVKRVP